MYFINKFNAISLKNKLLIFFIAISLMPLLVIGIVSYEISKNVIKSYEVEKSIRLLYEINEKIIEYSSKIRNVAIRISMDQNVISVLYNNYLKTSVNAKDLFDVKRTLYDYWYTDGVQSIVLMELNGNIFFSDNGYQITNEVDVINKCYGKVLNDKMYLWDTPQKIEGTETIPFYRLSKELDSRLNVGIVKINISEQRIYQIYEDMIDDYREIYIINNYGTILSCRNKTYIGQDFYNVYKVSKHFEGEKGENEISIKSDRYLITYHKNISNNWTIVCIEPLTKMMTSSEKIKRITLAIGAACIVIISFFAVFLSLRLTSPLYKIINLMSNIENEDFEKRANFKYGDEIGVIGETFDRMSSRLKHLINEICEVQQKKKEAEIKALIMQMNPHFMYNTLNSLIWLAYRKKINEIIKMVISLSKLFRISISNGKEMIMVHEEIEHAKMYLTIQKIRYKDDFEYEIKAEEEVMSLYTPKLILQPLIENSIYHGLRNIGRKGFISIRIFLSEDDLIFEVADNGLGIEKNILDQMNKVLKGDYIENVLGIGTRNVNERIKLVFGCNYGLEYCTEGGIITAKISIPKIKDDLQ